jgi:hypothetical protein
MCAVSNAATTASCRVGIADLITNTPEAQREYVLDALWIHLDTAKTLCDRADYDNPQECLARVRVLECVGAKYRALS